MAKNIYTHHARRNEGGTMAKNDLSQQTAQIEQLSQHMKNLTDLFSQATKRFEATPGDAILDKLDKIYNQNEKIAGAILSLIDLLKSRLLSPQQMPIHQQRVENVLEEEQGIPALLPSTSLTPPFTLQQEGFHPGTLPPPPLPPGKKRLPIQSFEEHQAQPLQPIRPITAPQPMSKMTVEERRRKLGI